MSDSEKVTQSTSAPAPEKKKPRKAKQNAEGPLKDSMKIDKKRTAYQEFCNLHRSKLKEQGLSFSEVSKKLGEMWASDPSNPSAGKPKKNKKDATDASTAVPKADEATKAKEALDAKHAQHQASIAEELKVED